MTFYFYLIFILISLPTLSIDRSNRACLLAYLHGRTEVRQKRSRCSEQAKEEQGRGCRQERKGRLEEPPILVKRCASAVVPAVVLERQALSRRGEEREP